jgi:hypothetical protein
MKIYGVSAGVGTIRATVVPGAGARRVVQSVTGLETRQVPLPFVDGGLDVSREGASAPFDAP